MPRFGPTKRNDLIFFLGRLGFHGPYSGGKHQFMLKAHLKLRLPNPHSGDIGMELLSKLLRQAGIPREDWERL